MNIDERIEALTMNLELALRDVESRRERMDRLVLTVDKLAASVERDGEHIRALVRIAELRHERCH